MFVLLDWADVVPLFTHIAPIKPYNQLKKWKNRKSGNLWKIIFIAKAEVFPVWTAQFA